MPSRKGRWSCWLPERSCLRRSERLLAAYRRGELTREEVREGWDLISSLPLSLYAPEDLMPRAVELTFETSVIVYDALCSWPSLRTRIRL